MQSYNAIIRQVAEQMGLPPVRVIARQPGVKSIYRVTMHYPDMHACDAVATLIRRAETTVEVVYQGRFNHKPLVRRLDDAVFRAFISAIHPGCFDKLDNQPDIPFYGVDLCLIERGAGTFATGVVLAPQNASGVYAGLFTAIQTYIPEVLRKFDR